MVAVIVVDSLLTTHPSWTLHLKSLQVKTSVNTWVQGLCGAPDVPSAIVNANSDSNELLSPKERLKNRRVKASSLGEDDEEDCCCTYTLNDDQENGQISQSVFQSGLGVVVIMPSVADILIRSRSEPVNFVFSYEWPCGNASTSNSVNWTLCVIQSQVFFNVPAALSVERSKEAFVTLLEIAEEEMDCNQIIISFGKDRPEKRKYPALLSLSLSFISAL